MRMQFLIIEDDENKLNQIQSFLALKYSEVLVEAARSLRSGLDRIMQGKHDLIILDMSMPTFDIGVEEDGGRPQSYAGREILRQMQRRHITKPVIVITQFDRFGQGAATLTLSQLDEQLLRDHADIYKGAIFYDATSEGWKDELKNFIDLL